ncbi:hypothetical protein [Microtetraspora glauca]|uniref:Uncharacterized protein n=1 Tax=Microtetraspora glauca TaxID=1996 RepID=A0ABV3GD51_MICGL
MTTALTPARSGASLLFTFREMIPGRRGRTGALRGRADVARPRHTRSTILASHTG